MITAAVVTFHTSRKDLIRLIDCVLHSSIDKFFIIDNSTNDALREFESTSERITYIYSVSIRPRACFSPSYNKVKSQTKHVWLLTLL